MKPLFAFAIFLFANLSSQGQSVSQEISIESNFFGTRYYQGDKRISMKQLTDIMESNAMAYKKIRSAGATNTLAGIMGAAGGALIGWPIGTSMGGGEPNWTLAAIGAGLVAVTIPVSISANKKAKSAVQLYNEGLKPSTSSGKVDLNISIQGDKLGITLTF